MVGFEYSGTPQLLLLAGLHAVMVITLCYLQLTFRHDRYIPISTTRICQSVDSFRWNWFLTTVGFVVHREWWSLWWYSISFYLWQTVSDTTPGVLTTESTSSNDEEDTEASESADRTYAVLYIIFVTLAVVSAVLLVIVTVVLFAFLITQRKRRSSSNKDGGKSQASQRAPRPSSHSGAQRNPNPIQSETRRNHNIIPRSASLDERPEVLYNSI